MKRTIVHCAAALAVAFGNCSAYVVESVRTEPWLAGAVRREAAIGRFEALGARALAARNIGESLAFALRRRGFAIVEQIETERLLHENGIVSSGLLTPQEIARVANAVPTRLYLQGRVQEQRTVELVEERLQVLVAVDIFQTAGGEKLGEIRLYARDLNFHSPAESREMAERIATQLDDMIGIPLATTPGRVSSP
ncbi:MAG: hypothetical protein K1X75_14895 [Leptospirales bacterium]|nr:hypothetical protein [Leptospirales bacterium]